MVKIRFDASVAESQQSVPNPQQSVSEWIADSQDLVPGEYRIPNRKTGKGKGGAGSSCRCRRFSMLFTTLEKLREEKAAAFLIPWNHSLPCLLLKRKQEVALV
uniref:Uncharacterized protein n=1 Tax=Ananas comosus var. bracteatus TaxID=296719 RepID=A0A6V7QJI3_ANACO|nr:unnamed protein product [Ananas comosus var. bracteatus]